MTNEEQSQPLQQPLVSGSLPTLEESKKAMLRRKTKFVDNMDKFSSRKNAYKQGWKDCYEWIMSQGNYRQRWTACRLLRHLKIFRSNFKLQLI